MYKRKIRKAVRKIIWNKEFNIYFFNFCRFIIDHKSKKGKKENAKILLILKRIFFCKYKRRSKEIDSKVNIYKHKICIYIY